MSKATYIIHTNIAGQVYFVLRSKNNEPILTSEAYTAHHNVLNGIDAVRFNSQHDNRFEPRISTRGEPYFVLKGGNHEILGTSEMYSSATKRDEGIEAVKTHAPGAVVIEGD